MDAESEDATARPRRLPRLRTLGAALARSAVDAVLPAQCLACRNATGGEGALCASCWSRLRLIEKPYCARLGTPFTYDLGAGALSAEAIADPPPFDRCRAVATFDDVARALVHGLKYRDRPELARWMGAWMARAGSEILPLAQVVVPVPLHRRRLWGRRFNQSALLAREIAQAAGKPLEATALTRIRATAQQVGLSGKARDDNVRGAFKVEPAARPLVFGRRVLLVDDVYTTGATVRAATRALLRAGASAVDVVVFARVVRDET